MESLTELRQPERLYIGIDQSYTGFGLVVLDETGHCYQKSLLKYPANKFDGDGARLVKIQDDLLFYFSLCQSYRASSVDVGMEGYAYGKQLNREKLGELGGIVKLCTKLVFDKEPQVFAPTALKLGITGKGNASKEDMVKAIQGYDPDITNDNLADAYGIACLMLYSAN